MQTKEELIELLRNYEGMLSTPMIDYLNSLIELEFSVVRENIGAKDRQSLSELEVYKQIAIYNIYNRALNIFKQNEKDFESLEIIEEPDGLKVTTLIEGKDIPLFNYIYNDNDGHTENNLGTIELFEMLDGIEKLYRCVNRRMQLDALDAESGTVYYKPSTYEESIKLIQLQCQLERFKYCKNNQKKPYYENSKRLIEITHQVYKLFEKDYDLSYKNFINNKSYYHLNCPAASMYDKPYRYQSRENISNECELREITRVRTIPNLNMDKRNTYI